jgi:rubrerythrin
MADKPSYLGLLNAVANAESQAHAYLTAWADVTPDPDVRAVLLTIAAREGEHGMSFAKRINELGFELQPTDDFGFDEKMGIATSECTDLEKLEALHVLDFVSGDEPDVFDNFFRDHTIDIRTGELLGRYISEERDTLRLLQGCCAELTARNATANASTGAAADRLASLEDKIDAVCRGVDELRQIVCAQTMPTATA